MAHTTGVFDIDIGTGGVSIIPVKSFVTTAAMSDVELDTQIALAKADLDAVAKKARDALRSHPLNQFRSRKPHA